jgi:hypothetical protein
VEDASTSISIATTDIKNPSIVANIAIELETPTEEI